MTYDAAELASLKEDAETYTMVHSARVLPVIAALEKAQGEHDEIMMSWTGPSATLALIAERDEAREAVAFQNKVIVSGALKVNEARAERDAMERRWKDAAELGMKTERERDSARALLREMLAFLSTFNGARLAQDLRARIIATLSALPFLAPQSETCVRNSPQTSDTSYDVQAQAERPPSESDNYIDAELWRDLCEKSDRTSPEGRPDMALINQAELYDYLDTVRAEATLAKDAERDAQWRPIETAPHGVKVIGGYLNSLGNWRSIMACYYEPGTLQAAEEFYDTDEADENGYAPEGWYEESETHEEILRCETLSHWQPCPYRARAALEMSEEVL